MNREKETDLGSKQTASLGRDCARTADPLTTRQYVVGANTMLARLVLKKGAHVPLHSHMNEQISHVVEGKLEFLIEGKSVIVRAGEIFCYSAACAPRGEHAGRLRGAGYL